MKKIYYALFFTFITTLYIFCFNYISDKNYYNIVNESFSNSFYIKNYVSDNAKIKELKKLADNNNLVLAKIIPTTDGKTKMYVYSKDNYFEKNILKVSSKLENNNILSNDRYSKYKNTIHLPIFSKEKLYIYNIDKLNEVTTQGKYIVKVTDNKSFDDIVTIYKKNNPTLNISTEDIYIPQVNMDNFKSLKYAYTTFFFIFISIFIIVFFIYHIKNTTNEIAIQRLNGFDFRDIIVEFIKKYIIFPFILAFFTGIISIFVYLLKTGFVNTVSIKSLVLTFIQINAVTITIFTILLFTVILIVYFMIKKEISYSNIVSTLNGQKHIENKSNLIVRYICIIVSCTVIILTVIINQNLKDIQKIMPLWDRTKNMFYTDVTVPFSKNKDDAKSINLEIKSRQIWDYLEKKYTGILFVQHILTDSSPTKKEQHELYNTLSMQFAFVNNNYLKDNNIIDENNKKISHIDIPNDNTIVVLLPEKYKNNEKLKKDIRYTYIIHKFIGEDYFDKTRQDNAHNKQDDKNIKAKFIYTKNDQEIFSYSSDKEIKKDMILGVVDDKNIGTNVYYPTIQGSNNRLYLTAHDNIEDENTLPNITKDINAHIHKFGVENDVYLMAKPLYPLNAEIVNIYRFFDSLNKFMLLAIVLLLIVSSMSYISIYLQNNNQILSVKKILGYGHLEIYKKIYSMFFIDIVLFVAVMYAVNILLKLKGINMPIKTIVIYCVFLFMLNVIISSFVIKIKESKLFDFINEK